MATTSKESPDAFIAHEWPIPRPEESGVSEETSVINDERTSQTSDSSHSGEVTSPPPDPGMI